MHDNVKLIIEYIKGEWSQVKTAPVSFIATLLVGFVIAYIVCNWKSQVIVDQLKEQNNTLRLQLNGKNDLIDEYQERLHLIPIGEKVYSQLTNTELKQKVNSFLGEVRSYLHQRRMNESEILAIRLNYFPDPNDPNSVKHFQENTNRLLQDGMKWDGIFNKKYRSEFIVLWQEVKSRLPEGIDLPRESYLSMTNTIIFERAIADLDVLTKSLPD